MPTKRQECRYNVALHGAQDFGRVILLSLGVQSEGNRAPGNKMAVGT